MIIEDFDNELDPLLENVMLKQKFKKGLNYYINIGNNEILYNNEFKLFLLTKNENIQFSPDISTKVF